MDLIMLQYRPNNVSVIKLNNISGRSKVIDTLSYSDVQDRELLEEIYSLLYPNAKLFLHF